MSRTLPTRSRTRRRPSSSNWVQGLAGAFDLDPTRLYRPLPKNVRSTGALLIVDEVQSGMGRCGQPFAIKPVSHQPGYPDGRQIDCRRIPCGALIVNDDISAATGPGDLGSTFGGGPLACALVKTVIDVIERDELMRNVRVLSR